VGHPKVENKTPYAFEPIHIADEELRPVVVALIKATFTFDLGGSVRLADEQQPANPAGEFWSDAPVSSYKYEPETALCKLATDVVLIGHARPPAGGLTSMDVGIRVGPVQKIARVFGDRFWVRTDDGVRLTRTAGLEAVPLIWEHAFGGEDASKSTPERAHLEPRNPVGVGFGTPLVKKGDHLRLPNIENPNELIDEYGAVVTPWSFGFTSPSWQPRASFAGTFDDQWNNERKPKLPADFDRRFFNAAAPGLVAPGYLRGDEEVVLLNTTSSPRLSFRLPGVPPPRCTVALRNRPDVPLQTNLDTVIVNSDEQELILMWRAFTLSGDGPHDVTAVVAS
jgi:hypothetical protein